MTMQGSPGQTAPSEGLKEKVGEAASTAADGTKRVADEAGAQTKAVAHELKSQAHTLIDDAKSEVRQQADNRAQQASAGLRSLSSSITALMDGRPEEAQQARGYLEQVRTQIDSLAQRVETGGTQGLMDDVANFARRRPGMFLAVAGVAGFAAGRLVRAGALSSAGNGQPPTGTMSQPAFAPPSPMTSGPAGSGMGFEMDPVNRV